jgi:hypothetical protein
MLKFFIGAPQYFGDILSKKNKRKGCIRASTGEQHTDF